MTGISGILTTARNIKCYAKNGTIYSQMTTVLLLMEDEEREFKTNRELH